MSDFSTAIKMSLMKILKSGGPNIENLEELHESHWLNHYMQKKFLFSVYGNVDNHLLTANFLCQGPKLLVLQPLGHVVHNHKL